MSHTQQFQQLNLSRIITIISTIPIFFLSCKKDLKESSNQLVLLDVTYTGVTFSNTVEENIHFNHILQDVVFNGGGVAMLDINNDDLLDLYFAGNMVSDELYLNLGNMRFKNISQSAGIRNKTWSTTVTPIDINQDGLMDIYVGKYMLDDANLRKNVLYVNNGNLTFEDKAAEFGIDDDGHCTAANFFDYDNDGDLDLYVGNQPFVSRHIKYDDKVKYDKNDYSDRLYQNNNGVFFDVTEEAGLTNFNYTLSATTGDFNNDGWTDLYVASDYEEPDLMWYNNGDGTFSNQINTQLKHISNFSMGVDIADFNNDLLDDIFVADMAPDDYYRSKVNMSGMNPEKFYQLAENGYHFQYMINTLQVNNPIGHFSEISQLAGVSKTDWSWATIFADLDNDGWKDLLITNGLKKDLRNKDYLAKRKQRLKEFATTAKRNKQNSTINSMELAVLAPQEKLSNYVFKNNQDLTFKDHSQNWGFDKPSWSQGMAVGDLDKDGDLDIVINNMDEQAFIYKNETADHNNYLRFDFDHEEIQLLGTKVGVYTPSNQQVQTLRMVKGYMSSSESTLHFGLGKETVVDSVLIYWNDGSMSRLDKLTINQTITIEKDKLKAKSIFANKEAPKYEDWTFKSGVDFMHTENDFDDFAREILLPHRMSRLGPALAIGDVNNDGLDDFFIGGAIGQSSILYIQKDHYKFEKSSSQPWTKNKMCEDNEALFFDADGDGDLDLYVGSGGNEYLEGDHRLKDRIYFNHNGAFEYVDNVPDLRTSTGSLSAGDYDGDGDLDLFIGSRQVPGAYGRGPASYLLQNNDGKFTDVSQDIFSNSKIGMVTNSKWADMNSDGLLDLIVLGEWMQISLYINKNGRLELEDIQGLQDTNGWWEGLDLIDIDSDGDLDIFAGNLGLNIKYKATKEKPFKAFVGDFDTNGSHDIYLSHYILNQDYYPVRGLECSSQQLPQLKERFNSYDLFAQATTQQILGDRISLGDSLLAYEFRSMLFINEGKDGFKGIPLPIGAQISCINDFIISTYAKGLEVFLLGNNYEREVETPRSDAANLISIRYDENSASCEIFSNFEMSNARKGSLLSTSNGASLMILAANNERVRLFLNEN